HVSNATVKIVNGSAVSKQKSPDKERIVKRPTNHIEIAREAAFLSALSMFGYDNKKAVPDNDQRTGALVMRRIKGKDLFQLLDEGVKFSADQMIELTIMMAEAIDKIHAAGIIHRDIKPENFMVEIDKDNNPIKVIPLDFDLSKFNGEKGVIERNIGTSKPVDYRAPEIKLNHDAYSNEKSDAYSFTVMLDKIIWRHGLFQKFDGLNRTETKSIKRVIKRGLEKKDGKRATVGEIAQEFKEIQKSRSLK
ncbi:MAG TPA: protein kinase, partial [Gammaproteobacteria bacterium]|nr:protein kinase [Gammaproteobacteria bacterium]